MSDGPLGSGALDGGAAESAGDLRDERVEFPVTAHERVYEGRIWDIVRDTVDYNGTEIVREYVDHPGAVAILALDERGRVLLIKQYRHPIHARDWEIPAGLLDEEGEAPLDGAKRELAEEADLAADTWNVLAEYQNSPGGSNENVRVYLARDLHAVDAFDRFDEEADIETRWVDLGDAVDAVLARRLENPSTVIGVLAAVAAERAGWASLGAADEPWPRHPRLGDGNW